MELSHFYRFGEDSVKFLPSLQSLLPSLSLSLLEQDCDEQLKCYLLCLNVNFLFRVQTVHRPFHHVTSTLLLICHHVKLLVLQV